MGTEQIIVTLLAIIGFCAATGVGLLIKMASDLNTLKTTLAVHAEKLERIEKHETVFITEKYKTAQ